jgi:uncharacterized protein YjiS (DUF1127 family)
MKTTDLGEGAMSAIDTIASTAPGQSGRLAGHRRRIGRAMHSLMRLLAQALERRRTRKALLEMTDDQLKDIGISRADAYREGLRSFWE